MQLDNLKSPQDDVLTACEKFGGEAAKAAEIAEYLDGLVGDRDDTIKELKRELFEVRRDKLAVEVDVEQKDETIANACEELERLRDALKWALGEHEQDGFRDRCTNEGLLWWRLELRIRAFGPAVEGSEA